MRGHEKALRYGGAGGWMEDSQWRSAIQWTCHVALAKSALAECSGDMAAADALLYGLAREKKEFFTDVETARQILSIWVLTGPPALSARQVLEKALMEKAHHAQSLRLQA